MRDIGLVGLPLSGKSTLFTALTKLGAAGGRSTQAVVPVPDPRLGVLAELERSRKVVPAQVRFVDVPVVLRGFGPDADPRADHQRVTEELLLADLAVVDSALERARKRSRGGRGVD